MRTLILSLLVCLLVGCAEEPPPAVVVVPDAPQAKPVDDSMSADDIFVLKSRLDKLQIGMPRAKVLEIVDVSSLKAQPYESANQSGIVYQFKGGHRLTLAMKTGDYDSTLKWAKFDNELWPQTHWTRPAKEPLAPLNP